MTLCPLALAVGCKSCPVFSICPLKGQIGDYEPESRAEPEAESKAGPEED